MMFGLNKKSGGSVTKFLEQVVLTLYGYAQNTREEYMLLNLIKVGRGVRFCAGLRPSILLTRSFVYH